MRASIATLVAVGLLAGGFGAATSAAPLDGPPAELIDVEPPGSGDCLEATPETHSLYEVTDDGRRSVLDVRIVLDGVSQAQAEQILVFAARPYDRIGVDLNPTFEEVAFQGSNEEGDPPAIGSVELIEATRDHYRGYRPHGTDVVYAMTHKELLGGATGSSTAGQADCIGGVRWPASAFAVGEVSVEPTDYQMRRDARIAAHEIAHLLGAHHHYSNCAEADQEYLIDDQNACTLMFPDVSQAGLRMSSVEAPVVRGHVLDYADNTPTEPPMESARTLDTKFGKRLVEGTINNPDGIAGCFSMVSVSLEVLRGEVWELVKSRPTNRVGEFSIDHGFRRARIRLIAPQLEAHDGENWRICAQLSVERQA